MENCFRPIVLPNVFDPVSLKVTPASYVKFSLSNKMFQTNLFRSLQGGYITYCASIISLLVSRNIIVRYVCNYGYVSPFYFIIPWVNIYEHSSRFFGCDAYDLVHSLWYHQIVILDIKICCPRQTLWHFRIESRFNKRSRFRIPDTRHWLFQVVLN